MTQPKAASKRPARPVVFYALAMIAFMFSYGPLSTFSANWVKDRSLSYSLLTLAFVLTIALQPVFGWIIGKRLLSARKLLALTIALIATCEAVIALHLYGVIALPSPVWMMSALFMVAVGFGECYHLLTNTIAMEYVNAGVRLNFGVLRGMGSASYALMCLGMGRAIAMLPSGVNVIFPFAACCSVVFMAIVWQLKPVEGAAQTVSATVPRISYGALFRANPRLPLLLIGIIGLFITHNLTFLYQVNFLEAIGVDGSMVGTLHGIEALTELPAMAVCAWLVSKFGASRLLIVCGASYVLKSLLYTFGTDISAYYAAALLQASSFGLYTPLIVYYMNGHVQDAHRPLGQSSAATAGTVGILCGTFIAGQILTRSMPGDVSGMKLACLVASVGATAVLILATRGRKGE